MPLCGKIQNINYHTDYGSWIFAFSYKQKPASQKPHGTLPEKGGSHYLFNGIVYHVNPNNHNTKQQM